jgi:serine/threonine protein kinase
VQDGKYRALLTDFGITQVLKGSEIRVQGLNIYNRRGLSTAYAAPEVITRFRDKKTSESRFRIISAGDIYAFSTVVHESFSKSAPWHGPSAIINKPVPVVKGGRAPRSSAAVPRARSKEHR